MWSISNLSAGDSIDICRAIIRHNIINIIMFCIVNEEYRVKKEACHIMNYLLEKNTDEITNILLGMELDNIIIKILNDNDDPDLVFVALNCLKLILDIGRFRLENNNDCTILNSLDKMEVGNIIGHIACNTKIKKVEYLCNGLLENYFKK
jgi:hypothetical protein